MILIFKEWMLDRMIMLLMMMSMKRNSRKSHWFCSLWLREYIMICFPSRRSFVVSKVLIDSFFFS